MKFFTQRLLSVAFLCLMGLGIQAQTDITITVTAGFFPEEQSWELLDGMGMTVDEDTCGEYAGAPFGAIVASNTYTLNDGETYTLNLFDDYGDNWNGGTVSVERVSDGTILYSDIVVDNGIFGDATFDCIGLDLEVSVDFVPDAVLVGGCTDPCASNFDPAADFDDGSCTFAASNDVCNAATTLPGAGTYSAGNAGSTPTAGSTDITSCTFNDTMDTWYTVAVPLDLSEFWVWTCGSTHDTGLSLWSGCPEDSSSVEIICNDDNSTLEPNPPGTTWTDGFGGTDGSNCGGSTFQSTIYLTGAALDAIEGTTVYIRYAGYNGSVGCTDELGVDWIEGTGCDASIAPQNPIAANLATSVAIGWDAVAGSVGCQVSGSRVSPPGPSGSSNILGLEVTSAFIPYALVADTVDTDWEATIRCACSITPLVVTPPSTVVTFTVPAASPRLADAVEAIQLFPNPADQLMTASFTGTGAEAQIRIVDILGQILDAQVLGTVEGSNNVSFDVSDLPAGAYFLVVEEAGQSTVTEFSVSH